MTKNKSNLVLSFKDNGNGIPKDIVDKIFEFRYSNTDGSGIGLYHVQSILEKYNSEIEYVPSKKGTEFHIIFPL
ncbi:ATP-binding protein [Kaistella anthropi]|nr:ATP-binding protein [Kaistella anthropi]